MAISSACNRDCKKVGEKLQEKDAQKDPLPHHSYRSKQLKIGCKLRETSRIRQLIHHVMPKILIIFSQLAEAQELLKRTHAIAVPGETAWIWSEGNLACRYQFEQGWIVISGVGLHSAQMAVSKYSYLCDEVWNFGLAGSLRGLPIGEILYISTVGKYIPLEEGFLDSHSEECVSSTLPSIFLEEKGNKLISSDFPIHTTLHRERLKKQWDVVDMEGYGIAFASASLGKKCRIWKIISDFVSCGGKELIQKHKSELSGKIADKIIEYL